MTSLKILIASRDAEKVKLLATNGLLHVCAQVEDPGEIAAVVKAQHPQALIVDLDTDPDAVFSALGKLLEPRPPILFHGPDDSQLILRAMRFGGCEYIAPGPDAARQLEAAIEQVARDLRPNTDKESASVIAVTGAKGGVGTSFVACQLATALAQRGGQSVIVDGQIRHGDVAVYLDLQPRYTVASIAERSEPLDSTYLDSALAEHGSGVRVLAAPSRLEDEGSVTVSCLSSVMSLLRKDFEWVICDTPEDFDERGLYFVEKADVTVIVTTPDVPSLNHTRAKIDLLARLGQSGDRVRVAINREERKAPVSVSAAKEFLGHDVDICIPNDFRRSSRCVNEGMTLHDLAPRSPIAKSFGAFATQAYAWCDREGPAAGTKQGLFARLKGN